MDLYVWKLTTGKWRAKKNWCAESYVINTEKENGFWKLEVQLNL